MKRLIAFGLAMAVATGAYAQITLDLGVRMVYDYRAVVKNTNAKTIQVDPESGFFLPPKTAKPKPTPKLNVVVKYVQNTVLYGYIIDGVGGEGNWTWGVIANENNRPRIGHLFYCEPKMVQLFDPKVKREKRPSIEDPWSIVFGVEGGIMLWEGERDEGDNVLWDPQSGEGGEWVPVQHGFEGPSGWQGLFGLYDDDGICWLAGAGFGSATLKIPRQQADLGKTKVDQRSFFTMNLAGSVIGGWYYCPECAYGQEGLDPWFPIDMWVCGTPLDEIGEFGETEFNSWISGTWTLKTNLSLQPKIDETYGPCYTAAALEAINRNQGLASPEDYQDYP